MFSWLAKLFPYTAINGRKYRPAHRIQRASSKRLQLHLETLEDRWAPAGDFLIHSQGLSFFPLNTEDAAALRILNSPLFNVAPVAKNDLATTSVNQPVTISVLTNDTDVDGTIVPTTVAIAQNPGHGTVSVNSTSGQITYTPTTGFTGQDTFLYTVKDNNGFVSNQAAVTVQVVLVPPVAANDQATTNLNQPVTIAVLANDTDPDGTIDPTTVSIVQNPNNGTVSVNSTTGQVSYMPTTGFTGQDTFLYTVKDSNGSISNQATVTVRVNAPPVAANDQATTNFSQPVTINVLANDTDSDGTVDPTTVAIVQNPSNGTVSVNATTGQVTYTPTTGFIGQDTFLYTVKDNNGAVSNQATVTVQVVAIPPVAANDQATTNLNQPVTIAVLANDTDPDGTIDPTTVTIVQNPNHGTVSVDATTGQVTYTPTTGFTGQDTFLYTVKDNNGSVSNQATVTVVVNAPPVAANDQATTDLNQPVTINVLANDTDSDGTVDPTTVTIVQNPSNGTVSVNATTGQVTYTPTTGFSGQDTFLYTVKDNNGAVSNQATVTLQVVIVPPVAANDQATTNLNQPVTIAVLANDTDPDGTIDPSTVSIVQNPSNGTVSVNATTGQVTYTPTTGFTGQDTFLYTVKDNNGSVSNQATVTVVVNAPPVAANDQATTDLNQPVTIAVLANDTDSDGTVDPTTVTIVQNPSNGTVSVNAATGQVTYTPTTGFSGQDTFLYTVKDNNGAVSNQATVTLQVVIAPPVATNDQATTILNQPVTIAVLANDTDPDGTIDPTTVSIVQNPSNGTVSVDATTGQVTYTPTTGFTGQDTFLYTVKDNNGSVSNQATVAVQVVPAAPVAVNDQATTNRNQPVAINVLANDTDAGGTIDPTTVTIIHGPTNGMVSVDPVTGQVTFTSGFLGQDSFTYTVKDNHGAVSNAATVTVLVNAPPVAVNDQATTNPSQAVPINVLANDTDLDGSINPTTVAIVQGPSNGTVSVDPVSGVVTYMPATGFLGQDSFIYTVKDNLGAVSNQATVTILVDSAPTVKAAIASQSVAKNAANTTIDLAANFTDADFSNSMVQFNTSAGPIDVQLFDTQAPQTVANFFDYVQSGAYNNAIFHRLVAGFVLQGGGYTFNAATNTLNPIPANAPVPNEFGISNTIGTIAMAKLGGDPNSATNQFFFNLGDNSSNLDSQNGGFTVFGKIVAPADQTVLNTLAATPVQNQGGDFSSVPLNGYTGTHFPTDATAANFLTIQSISILKRTEALTYSIVSNTNPSLVTASLNTSANEMLTLQYATGQTGSATITVRATDRLGRSVDSSFQVTVS